MIGPQHPRATTGTDPRGWLVFSWLSPDLQIAEDACAAADFERHRHNTWRASAIWGITDPAELATRIGSARAALKAAKWDGRGSFRPATPTERILLAHLAFDLPDPLFTVVSYPTVGVRNRRWPQLETLEVTP